MSRILWYNTIAMINGMLTWRAVHLGTTGGGGKVFI